MWPLVGLAGLSIVAIVIGAGWLNSGTVVRSLQLVQDWSAHHPAALLALYVVWSTAVQCIVVPTGSLTMIAGGYLLGYVAGPFYLGAMLLSGAIVHGLSGFPLIAKLVERAARRGASSGVWAYLAGFTQRMAKRPILLSALLRLVPVLPSAGISFLARQFAVRGRDFFVGTLLTGWIRPVSYAALGASLPSIESLGSPAEILRSANLPILVISIFVLVAVTVGWTAFEIAAAQKTAPSASDRPE